MTATQQFREDAKAGGCVFADAMMENELYADGDMYQLLLMPEAWQAVGKTRGWEDVHFNDRPTLYGWLGRWQMFIDHLADGKTIEEALQAIE